MASSLDSRNFSEDTLITPVVSSEVRENADHASEHGWPRGIRVLPHVHCDVLALHRVRCGRARRAEVRSERSWLDLLLAPWGSPTSLNQARSTRLLCPHWFLHIHLSAGRRCPLHWIGNASGILWVVLSRQQGRKHRGADSHRLGLTPPG